MCQSFHFVYLTDEFDFISQSLDKVTRASITESLHLAEFRYVWFTGDKMLSGEHFAIQHPPDHTK